MFCSTCGNAVHENAVICPKCGCPLKETPKAPEVSSGVITAGYVCAVLLPLVGFIIGIVLLAKGKAGHGIGAIVLSIFCFFFWIGVMSAA